MSANARQVVPLEVGTLRFFIIQWMTSCFMASSSVVSQPLAFSAASYKAVAFCLALSSDIVKTWWFWVGWYWCLVGQNWILIAGTWFSLRELVIREAVQDN